MIVRSNVTNHSNKYDYDDDDGDGDGGGGDDWLVVSNIFIFHYIWDNPSH